MSVNLLLSYAFHQRVDLADVRRRLVCGRLLIDSGAFTAYSTGRPITLADYAEYLEQWRGCWDHAITLDVIGDPQQTATNTRKLHARGLPVMPVFTRGSNLAEFDAMVRDVGYVAVGGTVGLGTKPQRERVAMLQRRAERIGGGIHALGVGAMSTLRAARPYSADTSTVSGAFRFGTVVYFNGTRVKATPVTNAKQMAADRDHIRAHDIDLAALARTRRMPPAEDRGRMLQSMSLAYACADEVLKAAAPAPAPHGTDGPGPHFFNSITPNFAITPAAELDRVLHNGGEAPRVWRTYGARHTCQRENA